MKIYLAGGVTVMLVKGRERELANKFPVWRRLFSFYFLDYLYQSQILQIIKETRNAKTRTHNRTGKSKTRTCQ